MRTLVAGSYFFFTCFSVGMKPLSERDENFLLHRFLSLQVLVVGMKPLSERDENFQAVIKKF